MTEVMSDGNSPDIGDIVTPGSQVEGLGFQVAREAERRHEEEFKRKAEEGKLEEALDYTGLEEVKGEMKEAMGTLTGLNATIHNETKNPGAVTEYINKLHAQGMPRTAIALSLRRMFEEENPFSAEEQNAFITAIPEDEEPKGGPEDQTQNIMEALSEAQHATEDIQHNYEIFQKEGNDQLKANMKDEIITSVFLTMSKLGKLINNKYTNNKITRGIGITVGIGLLLSLITILFALSKLPGKR